MASESKHRSDFSDLKVFNRWEVTGIQVQDPGLQQYIAIEPRISPRSGGKNAQQRFHKSRTFIVERLMNRIMNPGHKSKKHFITSGTHTGKAQIAQRIMIAVLEILEQKTKQNPIAVIVKAVEHAAPREEIIVIEYGGAKYPKAVECSPQRRVDLALKYMTQGAFQKAFNSKQNIVSTLSDEILNAFQMSGNSLAVSKKLELERQADSSR